MIFSIKPQIFELKCVFSYFRLKTHITLLLPVYVHSWEQRKLGDIGKARSGVGFPDADQGGVTGVPFFKVSDMNLDGNENEMIVANNYVTAEQIADHRWSPITELPAIFFAKVGAAVMLNRKRLCRFPFLLDNNTMAYSLSPTKWDADFAKALFGTVDLTSLVQVGALPSYNAGDVESMGIYLPSLFEQEQIGAFFKLLDNLITLHQCKCQIDGCRFQSPLAITWEQRKLGDFGKATGGTSIESEFSEDGIYKVISIGSYSENSVYNDQGIRAIKSDKTSNRVLNRNDLTMILNDKTTSGNIIGRVLLIEESGIYVYNQRTERIEINLDEYDSVFLYEMLNAPNIREKIIKQAQGNTQIYVNWTAISLLKYMIPSKEEQVKIGEYLHSISNLITLHQCE